MKLKEKRFSVHFDITKSLLDIDGLKLKKVSMAAAVALV